MGHGGYTRMYIYPMTEMGFFSLDKLSHPVAKTAC